MSFIGRNLLVKSKRIHVSLDFCFCICPLRLFFHCFFRKNGFALEEDVHAPPGHRFKLRAVPFSKNITFGVSGNPYQFQFQLQATD